MQETKDLKISRFAKADIDFEAEERRSPVCKVTPHISNEINDAFTLCAKHRERPYHYYIGFNGVIVAGLEETSLSSVSNSDLNDNQAITILVSNSDTNDKWPVSEASLAALFDLLEDISRRYNISLVYTGDKTGTITTHRMFARTHCPGPFLTSKLREMSFMLDNKLHGLPYIPQKEDGVFRVKTNNSTKYARGVFSSLNEAIKVAKAKRCNVYDRFGLEVYNHEFSGHSAAWDNYDVIHIGDTISSKEIPCYSAPGTRKCCLKVRGIWKTYLPELGGYIPNECISMVCPEDDYRSGETLFTLDEGIVEDIDEEANKVKVHGVWVCREPLLKKRIY